VKCNACLIHEEVTKSLNHLVLSSDRVYRLLGISSDDMDWYYILEAMNGKMEYHSCVGDFEDLFPILPEQRYKELSDSFEMNKKYNLIQKKRMDNILPTMLDKCYCEKMGYK